MREHEQREAGRELDAEIHARVVGVVWDATRCRVCGWPLDAGEEVFCFPDNCAQRPAPARRADEPPAYSTDIAAAFQVVEKMRGDGCSDFVLDDLGDDGSPWRAAFGDPSLPRSYCAEAATPALAICNAALDALSSSSPRVVPEEQPK